MSDDSTHLAGPINDDAPRIIFIISIVLLKKDSWPGTGHISQLQTPQEHMHGGSEVEGEIIISLINSAKNSRSTS